MLASTLMTIGEINTSDGLERGFNICTHDWLEVASPNFLIIGILDLYGYNPDLEINLEEPA